MVNTAPLTAGEIRAAALELVATRTLDLDDDVLVALQHRHYSVVVAEGVDGRLLGSDEVTVKTLRQGLVEKLHSAFQLFAPRQPNQLKRKTSV